MIRKLVKPVKSSPLKTNDERELGHSLNNLSKVVLWVIGGMGLVIVGAFWYWVLHWLFKVW